MKNYKYNIEFYVPEGGIVLTKRTDNIARIKDIVRKECYAGDDLTQFGFDCVITVNGTPYEDFCLDNAERMRLI